MTLYEFIDANRDDLIGRCRAKVAERTNPPPTEAEMSHGVPLFLDQLVEELRHGPSKTDEISKSAVQHGRDLLRQGFTISQVVHDYGDICQSITDLAVEVAAPISADDFRTLNGCLDDAIACAVTEFARERDAGESQDLEQLTNTAIAAFEALRSGHVGVGGSTGTVVHRSLVAIRAALADHQRVKIAQVRPDPRGR